MLVLFCCDGSKISYNAINNFSNWFKDFSVDILSVSDMTYLPDSVIFDGSKYLAECKNSTNLIIDESQKYLSDNNIKVSGIIKQCGNAIDSILDTEQDGEYDYIIMGSNGKKGIHKWLGSVSQEVASESKSNVYISKINQKNKNILFPILTSTLSDDVIKHSISDINLIDANVHIMTVYDMPEYLFLEGNIDSNWISDIDRRQQKDALLYLMNIEKIFMENDIKISNKIVLSGNPAEKILEYIELNNISLTVLGMRKQKSFTKLFMSSVSRRILENAPCDVLIFKE